MGVPRIDRCVVGGDDHPGRRVELPGQVLGRDRPDPVVLSVAARPDPGAAVLRVGADRDAPGQHVADVAVDVGVNEVLRGGAVSRERRPELLEIRGGRDAEERLECAVDVVRGGPSQRKERRALRKTVLDTIDDRPVDRLANREVDGLPTGDLDRLVPDLERERRARMEVRDGIGGVGVDREEVLDIRVDVRRAPGDVVVVAEDDARHARERDADDVVRAGGADCPAAKPVDEPDRRHPDAEVRVVGEERRLRAALRRRDDPVVRADLVIARDAVATVEAGDVEDPSADCGEITPCGRIADGHGDRTRVRSPRHRRGHGRGCRRRRGRGCTCPARALEPARRDHRHLLAVGREQLVGQGRIAELRVGQHPEDLGVVVPTELPRLDLLPGHRVEGGPRLRVVAADPADPGLHPGHDEREAEASLVLRQPRVHAFGVGVDDGPGVRREGLEVARGRLPPAERPDEPVLRQRALAEELGEASGRDMAPDLHLPHPFLGVDVSLGEEQVVRRVGLDPGDPRRIPVDGDGLAQPGDGDAAGGLWQGPHRDQPQEGRASRDQDDDEEQHDPEEPFRDAADPSHVRASPMVLAVADASLRSRSEGQCSLAARPPRRSPNSSGLS